MTTEEKKAAELWHALALIGPVEFPTVNLYARDIEMMRKAVAEFDAKEKSG